MRDFIGRRAIGSLCIALSLLLYPTIPVQAEVSFSLGLHLGIQVPVYPRLILIPGYPVYYAPRLELNYFFYDGLYWVFQEDDWYSSSWFNGPWHRIHPAYVPAFILRIPVFYYRRPPVYFRNWRTDAPPRWDEHWGHDWESNRPNWNKWDHHTSPRPAPLPSYQRQYSGARYPDIAEQQQRIRTENYRYQPREEATRQQWQLQERPGNRVSEPQLRAMPPDLPLRQQQTLPETRSQNPRIQQQEQIRDRTPAPVERRDVPQVKPPPPQQQPAMPNPRMDRQERPQQGRDMPQQKPDNAQPRRKLPPADWQEKRQPGEPYRSQ